MVCWQKIDYQNNLVVTLSIDFSMRVAVSSQQFIIIIIIRVHGSQNHEIKICSRVIFCSCKNKINIHGREQWARKFNDAP